MGMKLHLKALLYKEALLLRRDYKRLFVEFALPLLLAYFMYSSISVIVPIDHPEGSKLDMGYEASSERQSHFSNIFFHRNYGTCLNEHKYLGLVSDNPLFTEIFSQKLQENAPIQIKEFPNVDKLVQYAAHPDYNKTHKATDELCLGIALKSKNNQEFEYTFYVDKDNGTQLQENLYDDSLKMPDFETFTSLKYIGTFQIMIDSVISKIVSNDNSTFISFAIAPMAVKAHKRPVAPAYTIINTIVIFILVCSTLSLQFLIPRMQIEKVNKIRDFMRMMGMTDTPYYLSYYIFQALTSLVVCTILSFALNHFIFKNTNFFIIFIGNYLMLLTTFPFAVVINAIFKSVQPAKTAGTLIYILGYVLLYPLTINAHSESAKIAFSFMPSLAQCFSVGIIYEMDIAGSVGFNDIYTTFNNYSIARGWVFMILDIFIFLLLGLYLDNVLPGMGGVRHSWYFFLTSEYWCPKRKSQNNESSSPPGTENSELISKRHNLSLDNSGIFEDVDPGLKSQESSGDCLSINEMTKEFDDGKLAVNKVSLKLYKGQVFILLGHNGAGKTTALSMLTGLLAPTSGQAFLQGTDVFEENEKLKGMLGICPQESIYYEKLTVNEHLQIFSSFKGINYDTQKETLAEIMTQLDFYDSADTRAEVLSGGQKRKLSVLMAFLGNPQIIMLDEPSSGLDVSARQKIWEVVRSRKRDVIMLMTTHYMDEAEQLGDRIAIMSEGEIKCCGSPLFLKNRYGTGYQLTCVKQPEFTEDGIKNLLMKYTPNFQVRSQNASEIVYNLPFESAKDFSEMFTELDNIAPKIGISSYGVTITSLEDVFLKVGEEAKKGMKSIDMREKEDTEIAKNFTLAEHKKHSFMANVTAMIVKNLRQTIRTPRLITIEMILPFCLFLFAIINNPHQESYSYLYGPEQIPIPKFVPINTETLWNQTTDDIVANWPKSYIPKKLDIDPHSEIQDAIIDFDQKVFKLGNNTTLFGALYIESYNKNEIQAMILGNSIWAHFPMVYANILTNTFLKAISENKNVGVKMRIEPVVMYKESLQQQTELGLLFFFAIYTGLAFALPPGSFTYFLVKERNSGEKSLQILHGLSWVEFWIGRYIADFAKMLVSIIAVIILKAAMHVSVFFFLFINQIKFPYYELILIGSTLAIIPTAYVISFIFKNENRAMTVSNLLFVLLGIPVAIILTILKLVFMHTDDFIKYAIPDTILRIMPIYNLVASLTTALFQKFIGNMGSTFFDGPLDFHYLGGWIIMTVISFAVYWLLIWVIETVSLRRKRSAFPELRPGDRTDYQVKDDDVKAEETRVLNQNPKEPAVYVKRARKIYGFLKAVDDVSFSVNYGEVFALLGVNGAGKTTCFKMLTLQERPNNGKFYVQSYNIHSSDAERATIGYCPQENILFEVLSAKEHLEHYAIIKGIPLSIRQKVIDYLVELLNFGENLTKASWKLSGGNKRKLCTAIALLGNPAVLLLDELTTGLDPKNKRDVWKVVGNSASEQKKCGVVVTTHSMEEVEALASKVGIMVKGNFRCFGSVQHLKSKYGNSYDLEFKIAPLNSEECNNLLRRVNKNENSVITNIQDALKLLNDLELHEEATLISEGGPKVIQIVDKLARGIGVKASLILEFGMQEKSAKLLMQKVKDAFGGYELVEHNANKIKLRVPRINNNERITFAVLFNFAENIKSQSLVSDYSVCETTLDHIFKYFARQDIQANNAQMQF